MGTHVRILIILACRRIVPLRISADGHFGLCDAEYMYM